MTDVMQPVGELEVEIRSGDGYEVAEVNFPKRIVTVIAMPYERPADVFYGGRVVSRGRVAGRVPRDREAGGTDPGEP